MRDYIIIAVIFAALLFATPAVFAVIYDETKTTSPAEAPIDFDFPEKISLLLTDSDEVTELSIEEYLIGCLFAQIPVTYHEQALKAQAIAAHTYLLRLILDGVEISDDPTVFQPYFSEEKSREHYGDEYEKHLKKIKAAAQYGAQRVIVFNGEPIYAVYHSISAGVTNTAQSVWGRDLAYLKSVESSWDREHPDFLCINEITAETIRMTVFYHNRTASMPVDYSLWFTETAKNDFGYVISIKLGESLFSGGDMWRLFNLRSTSFDITHKNGEIFVIESRGFGHGAGLSQYGADVLGRRGFSYEEIIKHYYTGVSLLHL